MAPCLSACGVSWLVLCVFFSGTAGLLYPLPPFVLPFLFGFLLDFSFRGWDRRAAIIIDALTILLLASISTIEKYGDSRVSFLAKHLARLVSDAIPSKSFSSFSSLPRPENSSQLSTVGLWSSSDIPSSGTDRGHPIHSKETTPLWRLHAYIVFSSASSTTTALLKMTMTLIVPSLLLLS
jgi:hypothetical protein